MLPVPYSDGINLYESIATTVGLPRSFCGFWATWRQKRVQIFLRLFTFYLYPQNEKAFQTGSFLASLSDCSSKCDFRGKPNLGHTMTEVYVYNADSESVREAIAICASVNCNFILCSPSCESVLQTKHLLVRFDQKKLRKLWIGCWISQSLAINGGIVNTQLKGCFWQT